MSSNEKLFNLEEEHDNNELYGLQASNTKNENELISLSTFQNDKGEFDLDKVKTIIYNVEYYQEIIEENKESEKKSKNDLFQYKSEYDQSFGIYLDCVEKIQELEQKVSLLDDKKQKLDGRVTKKDQQLRNDFINQIDELKNKKDEAKKSRLNARNNFHFSKEEYNKFKSINSENGNSDLLVRNKETLLKIYKHCVEKIKEIDDKLNLANENIKNEQDINVRESYLKKYIELIQTKERFYENYRKVEEMIEIYPLEKSIKEELNSIKEEVEKKTFVEDEYVIDFNNLENNQSRQVLENIDNEKEETSKKVEEQSEEPFNMFETKESNELPEKEETSEKVEDQPEEPFNMFETKESNELPEKEEITEKVEDQPEEPFNMFETKESNELPEKEETSEKVEDQPEEPFNMFETKESNELPEKEETSEKVEDQPEEPFNMFETKESNELPEKEEITEKVEEVPQIDIPLISDEEKTNSGIDNVIESAAIKPEAILEEDNWINDVDNNQSVEPVENNNKNSYISNIKQSNDSLVDKVKNKIHKMWFEDDSEYQSEPARVR